MLNPKPLAAHASWPIVGHEWAVEYLQRVIRANQTEGRDSGRGLRHAYLFLGPRQVGKSTLVRSFAQTLLCTGEGAPERPCGVCQSCRFMENGGHPDYRVFSPLDKDDEADRADGSLKRPQADEIIHEASLRPNMGRYKVFLIQDAHQANTTFLNKILKTLEEPPEHVIICMTATDRSELLPTIVSRCELLELRPVPVSTIKHALTQRWQIADDQAELLARLCGGRFGWALNQLDDKSGSEWRLQMLETLHGLVTGSRVDRLGLSEKTAAKRNNSRLFNMLELWAIWWRDVLLTQNGCVESISNIDQQEKIERYASQLPGEAVQRHLKKLNRVEQYLHHTVNTRLALDSLFLDIPRPDAPN